MKNTFTQNEELFKNIIKTILWLKENPDELLKDKNWEIKNLEKCKNKRVKDNLYNISKALMLFSETKDEFLRMSNILWDCYKNYISFC